MKKGKLALLLILFILCLGLHSQWQNEYYVPFLNFTGELDTLNVQQDVGAVVYQRSDSKFYVLLPTGWTPIVTGTGVASTNADSLGHEPPSFYLNNLNDTFGILRGDTIDVIVLLGDSAVIHKALVDSVIGMYLSVDFLDIDSLTFMYTGVSDTYNFKQNYSELIWEHNSVVLTITPDYIYMLNGTDSLILAPDTSRINYIIGTISNAENLSGYPIDSFYKKNDIDFKFDSLQSLRWYKKEYVPFSREMYVKYSTAITRVMMMPSVDEYNTAYFAYYNVNAGDNALSQMFFINNYSYAPTSQAKNYWGGVHDSILTITYNMQTLDQNRCKMSISLFTDDGDTLLDRYVLPNSLTKTTFTFGMVDLADSTITINKGTTLILKDSLIISNVLDSAFLYDIKLNVEYKK